MKVTAAILVGLTLTGMAMKNLTIQTTPSMMHTLYWRTAEVPKKGDRVEFMFSHPNVFEGKSVTFTKVLRCGEGDELSAVGGAFACNGKVLGFADGIEIEGQAIRTFEYTGEIPKGFAFVMGEAATSFDSRYWGLIKASQLNKVIPII